MLGNSQLCDCVRLYGNNSLCNHLRSVICDHTCMETSLNIHDKKNAIKKWGHHACLHISRLLKWGVLFTLYISRLFNIVSQHLPSVHVYADNTQMYLSFRPCSIHSEINAVSVIEKCIADVCSWFIGNRLMIKDAKPDILIMAPVNNLKHLLNLLSLVTPSLNL